MSKALNTSSRAMLLGVGWLLFVTSSLRARPLSVGQSFPELLLPRASDGTPDSLSFYRGRKTVVHVFASW
ncbi:MAG: hypothetical protein M2R45_00714 [Verrucomicrobia subdivision 3 bacterium]|nr:hypothetical protein [Limisphaerales bacterium]MCS1414403.1 hypothetical protein [Limisphaerales bacterium]